MRFSNYQKTAHTLYIITLCGIATTMPLTLWLNGFMIILTGISAVLCFISQKKKLLFNRQLFFFIVLYLGSVVGLINSANSEIAYFDLEQKLPWLSLPLIFFFGPKLKNEEFILILKLFLVSLCCVNAYALTTPESFINQPLANLRSMTWFSWNQSLPIGRIYLGMYNVFGLVIVYHLLNLSTRILEKLIYAIVFLFLVVSLVNTFAKTAMIIFLVVCVLELGYVLNEKGKTLFYSGVGTLIAITIVLALTNNPLHDVAKKVLNKETFEFSNKPLLFESINFRYLNWESSWTALKQDHNWIKGVGTGDTQKILNELYKLKVNDHERNYLVMGYNSHNQYLTTWLNFGLLFFLVLVFQFFYFLHQYYRAGLRIAIYFTIIIMGSCVTESMFERQQGIVFYTFFQLLLFSRINDE